MADDRFRELLVLYLLGELTAREERAVERHSERCPRCRGELEGLREADALLRRWVSASRKPP